MDALRRIVRALRAAHTEAKGDLGVSAAQLFVLKVIAANPGQSLASVTDRTLTTQSSASEVVAALVERRLVERRVHAGDRRQIELTVTPGGARLVQDAPETVQERLIAGFVALPRDEQATLAQGLTAWIEAAGLSDVPATMFLERVARETLR